MEFDTVLSLRKSARSYTGEAVSEKEIHALIHAAEESSVGHHNDKGYALVVVRDPEVLKRISTEGGEKVGKPPHDLRSAPSHPHLPHEGCDGNAGGL